MSRCREVFHVVEDMLCVPSLTCVLPTCMLKVINNDTLEEIPHVFLKVAPHVYKKNNVWQQSVPHFNMYFNVISVNFIC